MLKQQTQLVAQLQTQAQTALNPATTTFRACEHAVEPSTNVQDSNLEARQDLPQNATIDTPITPQKDEKPHSEKAPKNGGSIAETAKKQNPIEREAEVVAKPVPICSEAERLAKQEREALIEQRMEENSLRDMIKNYATFNDCSIEAAAKTLNLTYLLPI